MNDCTCTPGSDSNGWREGRCLDCLLVERAEWQRIVSMSCGKVRYGVSS